jgi:predicted RNase H-like nuclease (RuvC/YqgF family)
LAQFICNNQCNREKVKQWLDEGKLKGTVVNGIYNIKEEEVHNFLEDYRWEGTAFEKGIDEKTRIDRFLDEAAEYRKRIEELEEENQELKDQLGILPF